MVVLYYLMFHVQSGRRGDGRYCMVPGATVTLPAIGDIVIKIVDVTYSSFQCRAFDHALTILIAFLRALSIFVV